MHPVIAHEHASSTPSSRAARFAAGKPGSEAVSQRPVTTAALRPPRLLDRLRAALRACGSSLDTEQAYVAWAERFVHYHRQRHPADLGEEEVGRFLRHLARELGAAPARRNQAFAALLFLYREVVGVELDWRRVLSAPRRSQPPQVSC